ncbi:MAG: inositol monophosphatase [Nitrospirota bacterium]|nr:inositol monophosphatase [Nitrospirota bacterium]
MTSPGNFISPMTTIAREAGGLLMNYFNNRVKIEYKGEADLVTEADRASEELITGRIRELWPDHDIVGEEGTRTESGSDWRWYIDPLDGTTNFAHGFPVFCVSMALEYKGERIAGVIYDPSRNELFAASKGGGATLNGRTITVSATATLRESLLATGFPSRKRHQNPNIHFYHQLTLRSHGVRRPGSAALDLAYVSCGRFDAFWEFNLNPWDTAAGVLIVTEAGGTVTNFTGGPFSIDSREVMASNTLVHEELLAVFHSIFAGEPLPEPALPRVYLQSRKS